MTQDTIFACDELGDLYQYNAQLLLVNKELLARCDLLEAELAALKEAAKGLIAVHRRHKDLVVYSEQDYIDIWRERVDTLAALVGEE